jgi:hypothetical protein
MRSLATFTKHLPRTAGRSGVACVFALGNVRPAAASAMHFGSKPLAIAYEDQCSHPGSGDV